MTRAGTAGVALILCAIAAVPRPAAQAATGSIEGTITLTTARNPPLATSAYGRRGVAPKPSAAGPEIRNVVVYLSGRKPATPTPPMKAVIHQRGEQFIPAVTAVTTGSVVDFPNDDPYYHNVFSLSRAATFDLGRYPSGESRSRTFPRPGNVKVFCHIHSQMSALIMVLDHPWFDLPEDGGAFRIASIPAGEHTIVAWHERIGERRERIGVTAGGTTRVAFTLPVLEPKP